MDFKDAYDWGNLFASPWDELVEGMSKRASALGHSQEVVDKGILWNSEGSIKIKFCFVEDPSDIEEIRSIYNDDQNISLPMCFIVVKQPDPSDRRGDVIFDIFRLNSESYLWHFTRVYTPPK